MALSHGHPAHSTRLLMTCHAVLCQALRLYPTCGTWHVAHEVEELIPSRHVFRIVSVLCKLRDSLEILHGIFRMAFSASPASPSSSCAVRCGAVGCDALSRLMLPSRGVITCFMDRRHCEQAGALCCPSSFHSWHGLRLPDARVRDHVSRVRHGGGPAGVQCNAMLRYAICYGMV